ncbi:hypothetical protein NL676_021571 [Syzygium grande]|nr:hypothetical protein NL676_021571 [Syzygium grande]
MRFTCFYGRWWLARTTTASIGDGGLSTMVPPTGWRFIIYPKRCGGDHGDLPVHKLGGGQPWTSTSSSSICPWPPTSPDLRTSRVVSVAMAHLELVHFIAPDLEFFVNHAVTMDWGSRHGPQFIFLKFIHMVRQVRPPARFQLSVLLSLLFSLPRISISLYTSRATSPTNGGALALRLRPSLRAAAPLAPHSNQVRCKRLPRLPTISASQRGRRPPRRRRLPLPTAASVTSPAEVASSRPALTLPPAVASD